MKIACGQAKYNPEKLPMSSNLNRYSCFRSFFEQIHFGSISNLAHSVTIFDSILIYSLEVNQMGKWCFDERN